MAISAERFPSALRIAADLAASARTIAACLNWHSRPPQEGNKESVHVMHAVQGMAWPGDKGAMVSGMFPYGAFEPLREQNPVFSTLFGYFNGLNHNLAIRGEATSAGTELVTGEY